MEDVHADRADLLRRRVADFERPAGVPVPALTVRVDCRFRGDAADGGVRCTDAAAAPTTRPITRPGPALP